MIRTDRKGIRNLILGGFVLFLLIYFYCFSGEKLINACWPLFIGIAVSYLLSIMIRWFERHDILYNRGVLKSERLHRALCTVMALILLLVCAAFILAYMGPQLTACFVALLEKVPSGIRYLLGRPIVIRLIPADTMEQLKHVDWSNWINHLVSLVNPDDIFQSMTNTATSALSIISTALFGLMFAGYFLAGREKRHGQMVRVVKAFLPEKQEKRFFHYTGLLSECFHDFIVCQATQALIIGVSATALMLVFRFPYATMIGTLNGFCALIPIVGGYIGAILGTLMILADAPNMAIFFLIFIIVLQNVIGTFVFPRLIGRSLGLPAFLTLAAVTIGSGMLGITGIMLGVPLTAFGYRWLQETVRAREAQAGEKAENAEKTGVPEDGTGEQEKA